MKGIVKAAGVLTLVLATGTIFSCKEKKAPVKKHGGDSIIPGKTVTLQVYDQLANYSGIQTGWFARVLFEKFNVKLNIIPESTNTYETRMESGNLGDIVIWGSDSNQYLDAVKNNLLYDWDKDDLLTDYGPYIKANMQKALEKNRKISGRDCIYGFGHGVSTSSKDRQAFLYTWDLRYDLYDALGKPEIKDLNDLHIVLKHMKEICPIDDNGKETYGVSLFPVWDGNMVMYVKSLGSAYAGVDEFGFGFYDPLSGTYQSCLAEDGIYLKCLKFLNDLYRDGLLDPDSQIQTYDGMLEKYANGSAFWNIFYWMASDVYNTDAHIKVGKAMYPVCPTMASPICYGQSIYGGNHIWSIGAKTEYPELCMAILNWLSTPEGFLTSLYGPKGITWNYNSDKGTCFTDLGKQCQTDYNSSLPEPYSYSFKEGMSQLNNTTWSNDATNPESRGEPYNKLGWISESSPAKSEIENSWRTWSKSISTEDYLGKGAYTLSIASEYSDAQKSLELENIAKQCANTIKTGTWRAMYAIDETEFNSIVSDMIKDAKSCGIDQINDFYSNEASKRKLAETVASEKSY